MASAQIPVNEQFVADATLQPILAEEFDAKSFATSIIQCQMVGETLQKLSNGIAALDKELYSQVVTNYEDLLSQATGIEALESVLTMMQTRIDSLRTAVDRISSKIADPYHKIVTRTAQLARLQAACDLLRKVIRMLYLVKRLKTQMQGGTREITKVAQTFSEIDQLTQGSDLSGIQILEEEKPWLTRARREVDSQAKRMVIQGLELMVRPPVSSPGSSSREREPGGQVRYTSLEGQEESLGDKLGTHPSRDRKRAWGTS